MSKNKPNFSHASAAAAVASAAARAAEGDTLPMPPNNLPALQSIPGTALTGATVLGYYVVTAEIRDCYAPDGRIRVPGDEGYYQAQMGRLGFAQMPRGWRFESRIAQKLLALIDGNPVLLEQQARSIGYARAVAIGPTTLDLGEIEI